MPIGLVTDDEFQREIARSIPGRRIQPISPTVNKVADKPVEVTRAPESSDIMEADIIESAPTVEARVESLHPQGRKAGDVNVPESVRKIIGEESVINGRASALQLANDLGVSPSSVSAYAKGATSTATINAPVKSLIGHINKSRARAIKTAQEKMNGALGAITQEKLDFTDALDLSNIAKNMSVVIKNLEPQEPPKQDTNIVNAPQFVIYSPKFRTEESFGEIIQVQE